MGLEVAAVWAFGVFVFVGTALLAPRLGGRTGLQGQRMGPYEPKQLWGPGIIILVTCVVITVLLLLR